MVRIVLSALGQAAQALCAVGLCAWFALHSSGFDKELSHTLDRETKPGVMDVDHVEWGPALGEATLYGLRINDRAGKPILDARRVHIIVDWETFHASKPRLRLAIRTLTIDDFELSLEWNRFSKLNLPYLFRTRSMRLTTQPPKKRDVVVTLDDITLNNGRLHLIWPTFGFTFDGIDTAGFIHVKSMDDSLVIDVPTLDAGASKVWFGDDQTIPMSRVAFRDYRWEGDGFNTRLEVESPLGLKVTTGGRLGWPEEAPMVMDIDLKVDAEDSIVRDVSKGKVHGPVYLEFGTNGRDQLATRIKAAGVRIPEFEADSLDVSAAVVLQDRDAAFWDLADGLAAPPTSPMGWIKTLPRTVQAPHIRGKQVVITLPGGTLPGGVQGGPETIKIQDMDVQDLSVEISANVFTLSAGAKGRFKDLPTSLAQRALPFEAQLKGLTQPTITGAFDCNISAMAPKDATINLTLETP
ncbi:MAG: hypothetical protein ACI9WU_000033 [Myxococcota bacterium]|jgi:hypothetical protein